MRVLLDECVPRKLKRALPNHDCRTMPEAGFAGKKNGHLLSLAESAGVALYLPSRTALMTCCCWSNRALPPWSRSSRVR